jgi:hypothetical protein
MKPSTALFGAIAGLVPAATAFAATGIREDNSGIFVWVFLGFCALIVIGQLLPAVMMILGFAKGLKKETKVSVNADV